MMKLLKYEGYKIVIEPEILTLKPFKKIWERDKSANKNNVTEKNKPIPANNFIVILKILCAPALSFIASLSDTSLLTTDGIPIEHDANNKEYIW